MIRENINSKDANGYYKAIYNKLYVIFAVTVDSTTTCISSRSAAQELVL